MIQNTQKLETILVHMGETMISTTETMENLAVKMANLVEQVQEQEQQIQQQGYQIFALSESIQNLVDAQTEARDQLTQLTYLSHTLVNCLNQQE